mgnify:CR=1 FL=1
MLGAAIVLGLLAVLAIWDLWGPQSSLFAPLITGALTGVILGDPATGLAVAGTLQLMWLGLVSIGAAMPPDTITGAIVGTAFAIITGQGVSAGIAVGLPAAVIGQMMQNLSMTVLSLWMHRADRYAEQGDIRAVELCHLSGMLVYALSRFLPVFLAVYLGAGPVERLLNSIPAWVIDGLTVSGKVVPALGFGLLLSLMVNKRLWPFFAIGFVLASIVKVPTLLVGILAVAIGIVYIQLTPRESGSQGQSE